VACSCEHDIELLGSTKDWEFLEWLSTRLASQLLVSCNRIKKEMRHALLHTEAIKTTNNVISTVGIVPNVLRTDDGLVVILTIKEPFIL
jgi:hypothetical protein